MRSQGGVILEVELCHGQLAVFAGLLEKPFNDWTTKHVAQGFAWRPDSVSFRSLVESGRHSVEVRLESEVSALHAETVRAIDVPFDMTESGAIEIGSISETVPLSLPAAKYLLRCEFLAGGSEPTHRVRLTFANGEAARFAVVRADAELSGHDELLTDAEPATG
jgi:hypothetical protein